jgi:hypothetical protein
LNTAKAKRISKGEELFITYGERANSFLLVEYGFAIMNNKYDFNRVKNITVKSFFPQKTEEVE